MLRKTAAVFRAGKNPFRLALLLSLPFIALFVIFLSVLAVWELRSHGKDLTNEMLETARAYYQQVIVARLWNAQYGGVYVEVTDKTQPNPYLEDPKRDILSTDGRLYTKINPAFMTRQISEIANAVGRYKFHMSSLKPINPANIPDRWEEKALLSFEAGSKESYAFDSSEGTEYFRYMAPIVVETDCLSCHANQGYMLGDVRGGLSISIPTDMPRAFHAGRLRREALAFIAVGALSVSFIFGIAWALSKKIMGGIKKEIEHERLQAAVMLAGAAAHELRQPMAIIEGFGDLLKEKAKNCEQVNEEVDIITGQCERMNDIISRMLNISEFRTKNYTEDTEIFDLGDSEPPRREEDKDKTPD